MKWEEFLAEQSEEIQELYEAHVSGLKSALQSERDQREGLADQLREATEALDEGDDEARDAMERITGQLEASQQRADFYAEAARPETGCTNPRLAFLAVQDGELFDRRGNTDWEALQESAPELFGEKETPPANAGSGTGDELPEDFDMSAAIRAAAGVQT